MLGCTHVSPQGIGIIVSLVHGRSTSGTVTVLGFAPGSTYRCVRGLLTSTVTGTRGGRGVSMDHLCITRYFIYPKPALGEVHPGSRNETRHVLGEADRVAVILGRHRVWRKNWIVNRGIGPRNLHMNIVGG